MASTIQLQADRLGESTTRNWQATLIKLREAVAAGVAASQQEMEREKASNLPQKRSYPPEQSPRT